MDGQALDHPVHSIWFQGFASVRRPFKERSRSLDNRVNVAPGYGCSSSDPTFVSGFCTELRIRRTTNNRNHIRYRAIIDY